MPEFVLLPLLQQRSSQALLDGFGKHHARKSNRWLLDRQEVRNLPLRLENNNRAKSPLNLRMPSACLIHEIANLLGDFGVAEPCLPRCHFHCDGKKLGFVALDVSPQKSDEVSRSAHMRRVSSLRASGKQKCIPELACMPAMCREDEESAAMDREDVTIVHKKVARHLREGAGASAQESP